jgi:hypothetical protein
VDLERPWSLAIGTLLLCTVLWFVISRWRPKSSTDGTILGQKDDDDSKVGFEDPAEVVSGGRWARFYISSAESPRMMAASIVLRMILTKWIRESIQCSWDGVEVRILEPQEQKHKC